MQAQKSLSSISADRDLWITQYRQEIYERDQRSSLDAMKKAGIAEGIKKGLEKGIKKGLEKGIKKGRAEGIKTGRAEGIKKGRAEGMKKGRAEEKLNIVKNALRAGIPIEQIALISGLTEEEIKQVTL